MGLSASDAPQVSSRTKNALSACRVNLDGRGPMEHVPNAQPEASRLARLAQAPPFSCLLHVLVLLQKFPPHAQVVPRRCRPHAQAQHSSTWPYATWTLSQMVLHYVPMAALKLPHTPQSVILTLQLMALLHALLAARTPPQPYQFAT